MRTAHGYSDCATPIGRSQAMTRRTRAIWAGGLVAAAVLAVAVGDPIAERWAVERDIRRSGSTDLMPAERGALADRLRAAAARPGLSPAARVRRLDAAGLAFLRAGRAAEAKPLFRAEYDAIRATAAPDELIDALNKLNNATPSADTAAELDEVRQNHAAIRALAARVDLLAEADYIIELGPVGGPAGGELLYQGKLAGLFKVRASPTAPYLRAKLKRFAAQRPAKLAS